MTDLSRIGLGTVQFGMHYGVSNRAGRPDESAVAAILERAVARGVGYLDTAPAYGDAEVLAWPAFAGRPPLAHRHQDAGRTGCAR